LFVTQFTFEVGSGVGAREEEEAGVGACEGGEVVFEAIVRPKSDIFRGFPKHTRN
jgi:hypothetical protein